MSDVDTKVNGHKLDINKSSLSSTFQKADILEPSFHISIVGTKIK